MIVCVVGLPSSGKTTFCQNLFRMCEDNTRLADDCLITHGSQFHEWLGSNLKWANSRVILNDPGFCSADTRIKLLAAAARLPHHQQIWWVCFENDPESCIANLAERRKTDERVINDAQVRAMSRNYTIEPGATVVKVWRLK